MKHSSKSVNHTREEIIEEKLRIIQFFDEFGAEATRKAFNKSRSTIYLWKQKLKKANGRIAALAPGSRTPIHRRRRTVHPFIEAFILKYRTDHPGADKTTITPALITACTLAGIKPVSESTVGRIIHDLKKQGRLPKSTKITINARTGKLLVREHKIPRRKERRKGLRAQRPGDIVQMDTVSVFAAGIKRYIFTAIDVNTRFAFACAYPSNSSANGSDFLRKFIEVTPFRTVRIQTDNGGEFEKHFDKACQEIGLVHFFNYPKHPQSNSCLERFNKTIQEQFVYWQIDYLDELNVFNAKMMEYLIWYNTEKPHRGVGNLPPLRYYIDNFLIPPQSNMLWTYTAPH
jgi:transposase InsO family protein